MDLYVTDRYQKYMRVLQTTATATPPAPIAATTLILVKMNCSNERGNYENKQELWKMTSEGIHLDHYQRHLLHHLLHPVFP
jgi:hypothetical protein